MKSIYFKTLILTLAFLIGFQGALFNIGTAFAAADVTKPVFKSVEVDKKEAVVGDTIKISVDAEDSESGIKYLYVTFQTPVTGKYHTIQLDYNVESGKY